MSDMTEAPGVEAQRTAQEIPEALTGFRFLADIPVRLSVEMGSVSKRIADILSYRQGEIVELDRSAAEPFDIMVNGTAIARGEVVTVNGRLAVRIVEIVDNAGHLPWIERR